MLSDIITLYCICVSETSAAPKLPVPYSYTCIRTQYRRGPYLRLVVLRAAHPSHDGLLAASVIYTLRDKSGDGADAVKGRRDCLSCLFLSVSHFIMNNTAKARLIFPKQQLQIFHNELHLHMVTICATVYVNHPLEARHSSSAPSELHWGIIWSKHPCIVLKISAELRYRIYSLLSAFMKRLSHLHLAPIDQKEENSVRDVVALHHSMMKSNSQPFCKISYTLNFTVQRMWFAVNIEPF